MFQDAQTTLCQAQAFTGNGPTVSTNAYDLGPAAVTNGPISDPSRGEPLGVIVAVTVAAKVSGGTETYQLDVIQSTVTALTAPDILASYPFTNALAALNLQAGDILFLSLPYGVITKEFIGIQESGTNTPTITLTAFIGTRSDIQGFFPYATKIVVL